MVSRLDRLFILLDTGSNESTRLAAAKQLGEVQRVQPHDLDYLLQRIKEYSGKSVWETRVAAGRATHYVLEHVEPWQLLDSSKERSDDKQQTRRDLADKYISENVNPESILEQFNIQEIMSLCPKLLSLDSIDGDDTDSMSPSGSKGMSKSKSSSKRDTTSRRKALKQDKEQLMRQRKLINKELGIGMVDSLNLGVKSTDIVSNDDLQVEYENNDSPREDTKSSLCNQDARVILHKYVLNYENLIQQLKQINYLDDSTSDNSVKKKDSTTWPLSEITQSYINDLFSPSWEIRHGATICLREIVKSHGRSGGRRSDASFQSNDVLNQLWLVDMTLRALCILALDKFGDFLFDQVVAPVRENAAQLLGCCVMHMSQSNANKTINLLIKLLQQQNWETRHGGVLGLKYSLSVVGESSLKEIFTICFEPIFKSLADPVDDVSAEAAAALVPVKDLMIETIPKQTPELIKFLWEHLANLDELTTSTSNMVLLLASLVTSSSAQLEPTELTRSIPRLWPLLNHPSTSVRISVLKALTTLLKSQNTPCVSWMPLELYTTALRLIFQRAVLENVDEVRPHIERVWMILVKVEGQTLTSQEHRLNLLRGTSLYLNHWLCLLMQPSNIPIDRGSGMWLNISPDGTVSSSKPDGEIYIGSCTFNAESIGQQKTQVAKCRVLGTKLLGSLYAHLIYDFDKPIECQHVQDTLKYLADMFVHYIKTKSANQRMFSGWTLESWAHQQNILRPLSGEEPPKGILPQNLVDQLNSAIQETSLCYDELASTFTKLQQDARDFIATAVNFGLKLDPKLSTDKRTIYNFNQIQLMCDLDLSAEFDRLQAKKSSAGQANQGIIDSGRYSALFAKKISLSKALKQTNLSQKTLSTSVLSSLACAHISWGIVPQKLKLIIEPLLDSIELEEEAILQEKSTDYLVTFIQTLSDNPKQYQELISNTVTRLIDAISTKAIEALTDYNSNTLMAGAEEVSDSELIKVQKIVLLDNLQRLSESNRSSMRRQSSVNSTTGLKRSHSLTSTQSLDIDGDCAAVGEASRRARIERKSMGCSSAICKMVAHFGDKLPAKLPKLWGLVTEELKLKIHAQNGQSESEVDVDLLKSLRLLEVVGSNIDEKLQATIADLMLDLVKLLRSQNPLLRHHSSQCIAVLCKHSSDKGLQSISEHILPMLNQNDILHRCGAIEAIALIIEQLQLDLVPKIDLLVVQILRRMSDQNDQIRLLATHCFGKLLSLMPLKLNRLEEKTSGETESRTDDDQRFVEQLLSPKKLDSYKLPFKMDAELRSYQQDGLNWLAFLNRSNLHGILCDEMGLGKTLMTICVIAANHIDLKKKREKDNEIKMLPSLIVCPTTLTNHWLYEVAKFLPEDKRQELNPTAYLNGPDRVSLRDAIMGKVTKQFAKPIYLVVASYDMVRNDIEFLKTVHWNYCVLDEGHVIKNGKTKLSRAIRLLTAEHRLILSGTPIQNNVTELWSLFDFLMPGFLGSERQFNLRYTKPILTSREAKCSPRELEAGALAMESLHRQVLPFILRRLKEDVLADLPPKIIQDYYCELSSLQAKLYEDFTRSKLCNDVTKRSLKSLLGNDNDEEDEVVAAKTNSKGHVFQALQYLKNVCNHPKLVLNEKHTQYCEIKKSLDEEKTSLDEISHSSKLKALKQLLLDCGIGVTNQGADNDEQQQQQQQDLALETVVNQHRALVFCQLRSMVNIIENDLLKKHLPSVTYLKLDGSTPTNQRQSIVERFNNDPSIDVLLLTTQIGGLGLNLIGADTVIFVEHDWNPTKDLQAMDRAHRIGQRKVVNVYRLITKGTLEEKIMGLQKFKTMVSNTVINQDNAGLESMKVDQLFDLFDNNLTSSAASDRGDATSRANFMDLLPELWDQQQYETEYDLSNFVSSLNRT